MSKPGAMAPKVTYNHAPQVTLRELMPENSVAPQPSDRLDSTFRAERLEFIVMCRPLTATTPEELEWDIPETDLYDQVVTEAAAIYIEEDIERADTLSWSSVGQNTGIGVFAMDTAKMDLISIFRGIIRNLKHDDMEF